MPSPESRRVTNKQHSEKVASLGRIVTFFAYNEFGAKLRIMVKESPITHPTRVAARVSGLTVHMVNYLCRTDVVRPGATPSRGRGRKREFTFEDLVFLRLLAAMLRHGV